MVSDAMSADFRRTVTDSMSPNRDDTVEGLPFRTYRLDTVESNVVTVRDIDRRWAYANLLHFFARTEDASDLLKYNRHARRFLTGGRWTGAYGAIAMPQIGDCLGA